MNDTVDMTNMTDKTDIMLRPMGKAPNLKISSFNFLSEFIVLIFTSTVPRYLAGKGDQPHCQSSSLLWALKKEH